MHRAEEVDGQRARGDGRIEPVERGARVVDEDVDAGLRLRAHERIDRSAVFHIERHVAALRHAAGRHHLESPRGQLARDLLPDAAIRAGDDGDPRVRHGPSMGPVGRVRKAR